MSNGIVLIADNITMFADTRAEFLRRKGYEVYCAYSPEMAKELLRKQWIHLAILDIRLIEDDDTNDESGLELAKDPEFSHIAKMILSGFPSVENVREALTPNMNKNSNILRFVSKREEVEEMVKNVNEIFETYIQINHELKIHWKNQNTTSLASIVTTINKELVPSEFAGQIRELDDLLRITFHSYEQITINRFLWNREDRTALDISAFSGNSISQIILQICRINNKGSEPTSKVKANKSVALKAPQVLNQSRSIHFEALVWKVDTSLSDFSSLTDFVHENTERRIATALENLYQTALAPWYQLDLKITDDSLSNIYMDILQIPDLKDQIKSLEQKIHALLTACIATKSIVGFEMDEQNITLQFMNDKKLAFANPLFILRYDQTGHQMIRQTLSPGNISMGSLLVDRQANIAITDFANSEVAPCELDFVTMELDARVDECETDHLSNILEMEIELAGLTELVHTVPATTVDNECRKSLGMIFTIRHLAHQTFQSNMDIYSTGLFHVALQRLGKLSEDIKYTPPELRQHLHYLLISCFIANGRKEADTNVTRPTRQSGIQIDEHNHEVQLNGRTINLTPTEYELLAYLHDRHGNLCRREDIMKDVFKMNSSDPISEKSLLNTHMGRLRTKIEVDPNDPLYILTVRGQGYKLIKNPK